MVKFPCTLTTMSSPSSVPQPIADFRWLSSARNVLQSHWTFAALQLFDILTTLAAFRTGAVEINPVVGYFNTHFGAATGLLVSKLLAVLIALRIKRRLWMINLFYLGVVCWNMFVLTFLAFHVK
jgi:hypothetical protein